MRDAQKRSKKTSKNGWNLACLIFFFWPECLKPLFYSVFGAMPKLTSKKANFFAKWRKTLHRQKKTTYLRTRLRLRKHCFCSGFVWPRKWGSIKVSWSALNGVQLSTRKHKKWPKKRESKFALPFWVVFKHGRQMVMGQTFLIKHGIAALFSHTTPFVVKTCTFGRKSSISPLLDTKLTKQGKC